MIVDDNQMTSVPCVFAGGDLVRGPDLAVRAVRDSRRAAAGVSLARFWLVVPANIDGGQFERTLMSRHQ